MVKGLALLIALAAAWLAWADAPLPRSVEPPAAGHPGWLTLQHTALLADSASASVEHVGCQGWVRPAACGDTWGEWAASLRSILGSPFYPSPWLLLACLAVGLLLLGIGSEQLQRYNRRLTQERHAERERIARDLHDTLLQGVQALLFRLQIWETDGSLPPEFRRELAQTVSVAKEVVIEGRNRILMLRPNGDPPRDLLEALSQVGAPELGPHGPRLRLSVIGNPRPLKVEAVEHLVDIAREAIRNTVQHAGARRVEMRVKYAMRSLVMQIADDGSGIELSALRAQPGSLHFGLTGMRERAEQLGGRFQVYSHQPRGTHIEVTIPSWRVYEPTHNWSWGRGVMPA